MSYSVLCFIKNLKRLKRKQQSVILL